jgi:hypothetical protein
VQSLINERSSAAHGRPVCHRFPHRHIHNHRIFRTPTWVKAGGSTSHTNSPLCASQAFTHGVTVRYNPDAQQNRRIFLTDSTTHEHSTARHIALSTEFYISALGHGERRTTGSHVRFLPFLVVLVLPCLYYAHSARFLRIFCCCCTRGHVGSGTFSGETSLLLHRSCVLQSVKSESTKG